MKRLDQMTPAGNRLVRTGLDVNGNWSVWVETPGRGRARKIQTNGNIRGFDIAEYHTRKHGNMKQSEDVLRQIDDYIGNYWQSKRSMKTNPHNIDRSGFRKGEHVGYGPNRLGKHDVWRIAKGSGYYEATARETGEHITAPTLNGISLKLTPKQNPNGLNFQLARSFVNVASSTYPRFDRNRIQRRLESVLREHGGMNFSDAMQAASRIYDLFMAKTGKTYDSVGILPVKEYEAMLDLTLPIQPKQNPTRSAAADEHASRELELFIDNDADLYRQQTVPIMKNLVRKIKAGKYDSFKAVKLWGYLMEAGAKKYAKEYSTGTDWNVMFTKATRDATALRYAQQFEINLANGEYNDQIGAKAERLTQAERQPLKHLASPEAKEYLWPAKENPKYGSRSGTQFRYLLTPGDGTIKRGKIKAESPHAAAAKLLNSPQYSSGDSYSLPYVYVGISETGNPVLKLYPESEIGID